MKLVLGVNDVPYSDAHSITTGDVAEILEDHYGVMGSFVELHGQDIAEDLSQSLQGSLETLIMGGEVSDPFASAMPEIEAQFRRYIDAEEITKVGAKSPQFPVPTQAALDGKSKRFKSGKNPAGRRSSFVDTGLYETNFKAWTEDQ